MSLCIAFFFNTYVLHHSEINKWYLPLFRKQLTDPLIKKGTDGIDDVIKLMDAYTLTREDWYEGQLTMFSFN